MVRLSATPVGHCAGTLITNRYLLTARECTVTGSTNLTAIMDWQSSSVQQVFAPHPSLNVALVQLRSPMQIFGRYEGYQRQVDPAPPPSPLQPLP
jgi:hypothetical protein